jgi:hypothetical protein
MFAIPNPFLVEGSTEERPKSALHRCNASGPIYTASHAKRSGYLSHAIVLSRWQQRGFQQHTNLGEQRNGL